MTKEKLFKNIGCPIIYDNKVLDLDTEPYIIAIAVF